MKINAFLRFVLAAFLSFCVSSCSYRKVMINDVVDMADTALTKFENEFDDLDMLKKASPGNIVNLEALLANDPENDRMLVLVSKAYFSYNYALVEAELEAAVLSMDGYGGEDDIETAVLREEVRRNYKKGAEYALRALELNYPECRKKLEKISTADDFINSLEKDDVPALFWYGVNLTAYINVNKESVKAVSKLHISIKAMKRIEVLDPEYYYGGAYLNLMTIYASMPPALGGSPELALEYYRRHKEFAGDDFLLTDLQYARYYLYYKQEREKYKDLLKKIISFRGNGKEYRMLNIVARERAKIYLNAVDVLFE